MDNGKLQKLAESISRGDLASCRIVAGFDGFIDEMITLVDERKSLHEFKPVADIAAFGELVCASAGHSSLREIVINDVHPGGCAVNLADGMASLGVKVDCFATLGDPIHSAFAEIVRKLHTCESWGREPGRTIAFEFNDGKLMYSAVKQLADFTPASVRNHIASGRFLECCSGAQVIALTDWTLYPHMTQVWSMLQQEVFSTLKHRPNFFIDLVDPSSRSNDDVREMAKSLKGFETTGPVTLGLNGNEANILCRLFDKPSTVADALFDEVQAQARTLQTVLGISRVVIHRSAYAVSATASESFATKGPYCPKPLKSTGAGDRFNAGFCLGLALGMDDESSLALGCATAGFFVRHARSANRDELGQFIRQWANGGLT